MKKNKKSLTGLVEVWYDGCCEPVNPGGNAAFGALIKVDGQTIWDRSGFIGSGPGMSNNVAEYSGMIGVLEKLIELGMKKERILVRGDNMITIMQMAGKWRARRGLYIPYFQKCEALVRQFPRIDFEWIPREQNGEADELSKRVLIERKVEFRIQPEVVA
jgi:ribonuclease HI